MDFLDSADPNVGLVPGAPTYLRHLNYFLRLEL